MYNVIENVDKALDYNAKKEKSPRFNFKPVDMTEGRSS